jgi:hypothetical protein
MEGDQEGGEYLNGNLRYGADIPPQGDSGMLYSRNTLRYLPGMAETKKPSGLRFTPEIMERMSKHAERELQSRNSLIERILWAYDGDSDIRDRVRAFVLPEKKEAKPHTRAPRTPRKP